MRPLETAAADAVELGDAAGAARRHGAGAGETDDLDRPPQRRLEIHERLDRLDRAEDAECTVEPAAFRYRVQMRPHENDLAFAAESREEIRGGVAPHVRASLG